MPPPDDLPSPREKFLAYAVATASSLVWIACVIPGVELAQGGIPNDHATPMARATLLIVPALIFLVAGPVGAVLARSVSGYRAVLAASDAFIAFFFGLALWLKGPREPIRTLSAIGLLAVAVAAMFEAVRAAKAGDGEIRPERLPVAPLDAPDSPPVAANAVVPPPPPSSNDGGRGGIHLALCILVLLTPASLLAGSGGERASYLAPFAFIAVSALGGKMGRTLLDLRLTTAILLLILGAHLAISVRYALNEGLPPPLRWTAAGWVAFGLAILVFVLAGVWAWGLAVRRRRVA